MTEKIFSHVRTTLRSLRNRNFRLFFFGQGISLTGTWMQQIAMSWLVYRLTNSAFLLGLVNFVNQIPTAVLAPIAGVLADRWNRHRIILLTQTLLMVQAFLLAFLTLTKVVAIWHVIVLGILFGAINALDIPARQSFIVMMIDDRESLGNAIALNSSLFNAARLIGPAVAGVLIAVLGEGLCFLLNGLSFIAVLISLQKMRLSPVARPVQTQSNFDGLKQGFSYALGSLPIRSILILLAVIAFVATPYSVLMPVFAEKIFHGTSKTLGLLMGSAGFGALLGAVYLASRRTVLGLGRLMDGSTALLGLSLFIFASSKFLWLSMALLVLTGFGMMVLVGSSNIFLQTIVDEDKRGRVMSFYTMTLMGMAPLGVLLAGSSAGAIGVTNTVRIGAVCCLFAAIFFWMVLPSIRDKVRPFYVKTGILPEV